jgi:hypothetical protein
LRSKALSKQEARNAKVYNLNLEEVLEQGPTCEGETLRISQSLNDLEPTKDPSKETGRQDFEGLVAL